LFADEPTGALNSKASMEVLHELVEANEAGATILMVTHSEKVAACSDRIIYLMDGDVQGELVLGKMSGASDKSSEQLMKRERQLRKWLEEMGW
ncbi:MAG: ABC transporter ATP-binding protein, partial [Lachnospiraceae bacterium]|nr:ABC transporter ATP-binding protein [Lachnospiraceae bacterium]